jgi:hypothetical protein
MWLFLSPDWLPISGMFCSLLLLSTLSLFPYANDPVSPVAQETRIRGKESRIKWVTGIDRREGEKREEVPFDPDVREAVMHGAKGSNVRTDGRDTRPQLHAD